MVYADPAAAQYVWGTGLQHQSSYWYLGHFARFIRPGAQRVMCAASRAEVEASAFVNTDGSLALLAMNRTYEPLRFTLRGAGPAQVLRLPPRSIATGLASAHT